MRAHTNGRNLCCSVSKWNGAACLRIKLAYLFTFFIFIFEREKWAKVYSLRTEEENNKIENKYKVGTRAFLGNFIGRSLCTRKRPFSMRKTSMVLMPFFMLFLRGFFS